MVSLFFSIAICTQLTICLYLWLYSIYHMVLKAVLIIYINTKLFSFAPLKPQNLQKYLQLSQCGVNNALVHLSEGMRVPLCDSVHRERSLIKTKHAIYFWQEQMSTLLLQIKACLVASQRVTKRSQWRLLSGGAVTVIVIFWDTHIQSISYSAEKDVWIIKRLTVL